MTQIIPVAPGLDSLNNSVLSRVEARVDEHCPPALGGGESIRPSSGEGFQDKSGTVAATLHQGKQVSTTPSPPRDYEMPPRVQRERKPFFCLFLFCSLNFASLAKACTTVSCWQLGYQLSKLAHMPHPPQHASPTCLALPLHYPALRRMGPPSPASPRPVTTLHTTELKKRY